MEMRQKSKEDNKIISSLSFLEKDTLNKIHSSQKHCMIDPSLGPFLLLN